LRRALFSLFVLLALVVSVAACQSQFYELCQRAVACRGGNDQDVDACIEEERGRESAADAYGCGGAFDKLFECEDTRSTCELKIYSDNHKCDLERATVESCKRIASAVPQ